VKTFCKPQSTNKGKWVTFRHTTEGGFIGWETVTAGHSVNLGCREALKRRLVRRGTQWGKEEELDRFETASTGTVFPLTDFMKKRKADRMKSQHLARKKGNTIRKTHTWAWETRAHGKRDRGGALQTMEESKC